MHKKEEADQIDFLNINMKIFTLHSKGLQFQILSYIVIKMSSNIYRA